DLRRPDLLTGVAAPVRPGGEERVAVAREAVVVAELVAGIGACGRLVGHGRRDLDGRLPRRAAVGRHLVVDVDLLPVRIVDGVVVHRSQRPVRLIDGQELVELVVQTALIVELHAGTPGGAAVRGAREPDPRLAGGAGVGAGLP